MIRLIHTEFEKLIKTKAAKFAAIILVVSMSIILFTEYQDVRAFRGNLNYQNEVMSWEEREQNIITFGMQSLNEDNWLNSLEKDQIQRRLAIAQYRLENHIPKDIIKNVWWFVNDNAFTTMSLIVTLLSILLAGTALAGEYSQHMIRQVLLLPYRREKILAAKFFAVGLSALIMYGFLLITGLLSGLIFHGINGFDAKVVLYFGDSITVMNMSVYSLIVSLLQMIPIVFYLIVTFLLCVLTKSLSASVMGSAALAVLVVPISNYLSVYYPFVYYLPFCNLDFRRYLEFGTTMPSIEYFMKLPVIQGVSLMNSLTIILITMALCLFITFFVFKRQDH